MSDEELRRLAAANGVATSYHDWRGREITVGAGTLRAVLRALGVDPDDPRASAPSRRLLPPAPVVRSGAPLWTPATDEPAEVTLLTGTELPLPSLGRGRDGRAGYELPADLRPGRYRVRATAGGRTEESPLIVAPDRLSSPKALGDRRVWGLMAQLYAVRSRRSWGMGDLHDLAVLALWSGATLGAGFALVNPLHAGEPGPGIQPSPYLPTGRRFGNALYLHVEDVPEYAELDAAGRARVSALAQRARAASGELIDRDAVWAAKREALELLYAVDRTPAREAAYRAFAEREGTAAIDFATWCALAEEYGGDIRDWPAALRDPRSPGVVRERALRWRRVDFHRWTQWLLDEQLASAQRAARDSGMPLGIVHDFAVGVQAGGADAWMYGETLAHGVEAGAPPDEFNPRGQAWALPPWHPGRLAEAAYDPFAEQLRQALRHGGGLRVDHVMGLFRLWWVPRGASPDEGTYVRYDHEAMVGVLLLEAWRRRALVVGEDLGTVEPWVRDHLASRGVLGTSMVWFEREADGAPRAPGRWRRDCLATVATHDLPPVASVLSGEHVELRDKLGVLGRPAADERADSDERLEAWRRALTELGLLAGTTDGDGDDDGAVIRALHAFLAETPARLIGVQLSDLTGERRPQNVPGTVNDHPNWRLPLGDAGGRPVTLEDLMSDPRVRDLVAPLIARPDLASARAR